MDARTAQRLLAPIYRRIRLLLARGIGHLVNPDAKMQTMQVELLEGEVLDGVEHFEPYGFTSNPLPGFEALCGSFSGRRGHTVVLVAADRRYRKKNLAPGEVALFTDEGDVIHFKRGKLIEITAGTKVKITAPEVEVVASTKVTFTSPLVAMSGELQVAGKITGQGGMAISGGNGAEVTGDVTVTGGNVTADGIGLKTHVHGGVQPGSGTTGGPQG